MKSKKVARNPGAFEAWAKSLPKCKSVPEGPLAWSKSVLEDDVEIVIEQVEA